MQTVTDSSGSAQIARTIPEGLELRAAAMPHRIAVTFIGSNGRDDAVLTNAELLQKVQRLASGLMQRHLTGQRALISCGDIQTTVEMFLACLCARVLPVTVPPFARAGQLGRSTTIIEDCSPAAGLGAMSELVAAADATRHLAPKITWLSPDDLLEDVRLRPLHHPSGDDVAYLQYTSGSTAAPRGVVVTHGCLSSYCRQLTNSFTMDDRTCWVGWLPLFHDLGLVSGVIQPILGGYRTVLMQPMIFIKRPLSWLSAISRHRGTISGGPNFAYEMCLGRISEKDMSELDLTSWEVAANGSETVRWSTIARFSERFASAGLRPGAVRAGYGLAEATCTVTVAQGVRRKYVLASQRHLAEGVLKQIEAFDVHQDELEAITNLGPPLPGLEVLVVDPDRRRELPEGRVGEIWMRGPSVAAGYWKRPEETKATFRAILVGSAHESCYLRTGDLGALLEGELYVTSRLKDLIVVRGQNHFAPAIEATVERCSPAIRRGRVVAFSQVTLAGEALAVALEVRLPADQLATVVEEVLRRVAQTHRVRPFAVYVLPIGSIPKTSSGKLARQACRRMVLAREMPPIYEWTAREDDE